MAVEARSYDTSGDWNTAKERSGVGITGGFFYWHSMWADVQNKRLRLGLCIIDSYCKSCFRTALNT